MVLDKKALPMAYKEVIKIIEHLPEELYVKIPDEIIQNLMLEMDDAYNYNISSYEEVRMLRETEELLAVIYRDYLASDKERNEILLREKQEEINEELERRKKYPVDNIFEKTKKDYENINILLPVEIEKKNIIQKLIDFIKSKFIIRWSNTKTVL